MAITQVAKSNHKASQSDNAPEQTGLFSFNHHRERCVLRMTPDDTMAPN